MAALCLLTLAACTDKANGMADGNGMVQFAQGHRQAAPELSGLTINHGIPFSLAAQKGHVVVIHYWASWCDQCRDELPQLDDLATTFKPKGVTFMGVDFHGDGNTDAAAKAFLIGHNVPYDSLFDPDSKTVLAFRGKVTIAAPPITVIIDKQGNIAAVVNGGVTYSDVRDTLNRLDAEPA
jgi:thiol-disulfide isomerase/thioredoxin